MSRIGWLLFAFALLLALSLSGPLADRDAAEREGALLDEVRELRREVDCKARMVERLGRDLAEARREGR